MSPQRPFDAVLASLQQQNLSIPVFLDSVLHDGRHRNTGLCMLKSDDVTHILGSMHTYHAKETFSWAFDLVAAKLQKELSLLSQRQHGLHFNVKHAESSYLDGSFMQEAAAKMKANAPQLWNLMHECLDARRVKEPKEEVEAKERGTQSCGNPDEEASEALMDMDVDDEQGENDNGDIDMASDVTSKSLDLRSAESVGKRKRKKKAAHIASRNTTLMVIKSVVCISIFLQNRNKNCNYLQSILGIFYHSALVPEKVIEVLSHAGLSVSLSSIHSAVKSLSKEASQKLRDSVQTLTMAFAYDNFDIAFKVAEPTVEHDSSFVSATSATAIPIMDMNNTNILRCSAQLWERDPNNMKSTTPVTFDDNDLEWFYERSGSVFGGDPLSPMMRRLSWHVRHILVHRVQSFAKYKEQLGQPVPVNQIPVHRTHQVPCRAMNIKESTLDGNIQVMEDLLRQGGLGEPSSKGFEAGSGDVDISDWVLLVHGDLLTKERLESVKRTRRVEDTPKRRFQYVVFVPGLFHFEMACADALWRTWVQPDQSRKDPNSMFQHAGILRPTDSGKFGSKPGYQRTHQVIQHDIWAAMLDCWGMEARAENAAWTSLEDFAAAEPSWVSIEEMSHRIVKKYIGTTSRVRNLRNEEERDAIFENQILRNRDELLYLELHHAIKAGDIGRVEESFLYWVFIFKATGKHKYAHHMIQMMLNLDELYPPELAHIIRMNWLCNPTGKDDGFRGVDWMVERNNLYIKVIYGGSGPNRTIQRVIEESILIEFYRQCHVTIENGFHLEHQTIRHSPPDMTRTLQKLQREFAKNKPHTFTPGRTARYEVPDQIYGGLSELQTSGALDYGVAEGNEAEVADKPANTEVIEGIEGVASIEGMEEAESATSDVDMDEDAAPWQQVSEFLVEVEPEDLEID